MVTSMCSGFRPASGCWKRLCAPPVGFEGHLGAFDSITTLDMGWWLFWNVIVNVLAWWMVGEIGLHVGLTFTGPGLAIDLIGFSIGAAIGFAGLAAQGCV